MLQDMRRQFAQFLHEMGFLKSDNPHAADANRNSGTGAGDRGKMGQNISEIVIMINMQILFNTHTHARSLVFFF